MSLYQSIILELVCERCGIARETMAHWLSVTYITVEFDLGEFGDDHMSRASEK